MQERSVARNSFAVLLLAVAGCVERPSPPDLTVDTKALEAADQAYATAWLTNDPEQVMATLTEDAVIMPSGIPAIEGHPGIREFWWPADSPPATVTRFDLVRHEAGGAGDAGYVRGSFFLEFDYDGASYTGTGDYMTLLRRLPDSSWLISHRAWNDLPVPAD